MNINQNSKELINEIKEKFWNVSDKTCLFVFNTFLIIHLFSHLHHYFIKIYYMNIRWPWQYNLIFKTFVKGLFIELYNKNIIKILFDKIKTTNKTDKSFIVSRKYSWEMICWKNHVLCFTSRNIH